MPHLTRSKSAPRLTAAIQERYSLAFDTEQANLYHGVRPGYQPEVIDFLTAQPNGLAMDLGAGTGLFSAALLQAGWDVVAVDPAANMLEVLAAQYPAAAVVQSSVESLETSSWAQRADLVVAAQAWHWIDTQQGSRKVAELLSYDGVFGIVYHQIDTTQDWVLRLCKIMHSGDIHPVDQPPRVNRAFTTPRGQWWYWQQKLGVEQIHQLMMTRAYYLKTSDAQRRRMHENLDWYLLDHLGYKHWSTVELPYVTVAWRMQHY